MQSNLISCSTPRRMPPIREGDRFGRLLVTGEAPQANRYRRRWYCACDCGKAITVWQTSLRSGVQVSCGCYKAEKASQFHKTHGHASGYTCTGEYSVWKNMLDRCRNPKRRAYQWYGAKGIAVCERWLSFESFFADMGSRPSEDHSIDRYPDKAGNYEPGNCRWATQKQQTRNTSRNKIVTFRGQAMSVAEWSELTGMPYDTLCRRLLRWGDVERAFMQPPGRDCKTPWVPFFT